MRIRMAEWTVAPVMLAVFIFTVPCFAHSNPSSNALATTISANPDRLVNDGSTSPGSATDAGAAVSDNGAATSSNGAADWERSATEAARNIEVAAENAYHDMKQNVSDFSLATKVQAVLHENKYTRSSDVHATANNGIVTLTGQVPSEESARRAQEIVAGIYGVKAVNNGLNYPHRKVGGATPPDSVSTRVAHPPYSKTAPVESAPAGH
jgi:BON domain